MIKSTYDLQNTSSQAIGAMWQRT